MSKIQLSKRLRAFADAEKLSGPELAKRAGINWGTFCNYYYGHRKPHTFTMQALLKLLSEGKEKI